MGDNIYTAYWQSVLPNLIKQFQEGKQIVQLEVKQLTQFGDRQSYYANFRINHGQIEIPKNAYAQGRDLFTVLIQDEYFKENLSNRTIQVTISKALQLKIEILADNAPDFFTEEDFTELSRFTKRAIESNNEEHKKTYEFLKNTYVKVEYWARQVNQKLFPNGIVQVRKKPTNQAGKFEYYQWAKIYPDKGSFEYEALAFTIGIDTDNQFHIKIDTVGLSDSDARRQSYLQRRGDFDDSEIVKILPDEQVLDKGWKYLIDLTANIILTLKPSFDSLFQLFKRIPQTISAEQLSIKSDMALNTILYGPPGTGKTYNTIDKSVEIVDKSFYEENKTNREALTRRFRELYIHFDKENPEGQIGFCTFHQSMSYEEFIEGIKPDLSEVENSITYSVKDGIFKKICRIAAQKFDVKDNFNTTYEKLLQEIEDNDGSLVLKTLKKGKEFTVYENSKGNLRFHANTIKAYEGVITKELISTYLKTGEAPDWPSYTRAVGEYLKSKFGYINQQKTVDRNYVLIIDEINRGNVSQIFGELITLIEDDKRTGKEESLTISLPYSKKSFSVPSNLYIIGTMNTADRSIEALDTALRRRFVFEEKNPDITKIKQSPDGIDLPRFLSILNQRLEALLSKDHTIGHAWLMGIDTLEKLQAAFKNKILPLLQEFFHNDYAKIGLILGNNFIVQTQVSKGLFAKFKDDNELAAEYEDKVIYNLKDPYALLLEDFKSIYE